MSYQRQAVIICGSRDWADAIAVGRVVRGLDRETIVIHGDARGADRMAGQTAIKCGMFVVPMAAQWDRDGKSAGPRRNEAMLRVLVALQACGYRVAVHAFPLGRSIGTRHMMRLADAAGIEVNDHGRRP